MITFNDQQKQKIQNLKPLIDSKFSYNATRWTNLKSEFKNLIKDFEGQEITRQNVIDTYKEYYADNSKDFMKAFVLTMVWGFADTGYGTHRTNNYISEKDNIDKIKAALDFIQQDRQDSLKNAFKKLNEIKGLGVSYSTKVLYFATRAIYADNYALIFDIRVAVALVKLTTPKDVYEIVNVGPSSKFIDYQKFNTLIHNLAKENQVEADQMEMYLFNQDFE